MLAAVASMLFLPKLLAALVAGARDARAFGGPLRLVTSVVLEFVVSALLAPIRMLFHTQFVLAALAGWAIQWKSPKRDDASTSFQEAIDRHGWQTLVGVAWVGVVAWQAPGFLPWIAPVAVGPAARGAAVGADEPHVARHRRARRGALPDAGRDRADARRWWRRASTRAKHGRSRVSPTRCSIPSCSWWCSQAARRRSPMAAAAAPGPDRARPAVRSGSALVRPSGAGCWATPTRSRRCIARCGRRRCTRAGRRAAQSRARRSMSWPRGRARVHARCPRWLAASAARRRRAPPRPAAACRPRTPGPRPSAVAAGGRRRRRAAAIRA